MTVAEVFFCSLQCGLFIGHFIECSQPHDRTGDNKEGTQGRFHSVFVTESLKCHLLAFAIFRF